MPGKPAFAFIHGNWALDNSRQDGGRNYCGVNSEIRLLRDLGVMPISRSRRGSTPRSRGSRTRSTTPWTTRTRQNRTIAACGPGSGRAHWGSAAGAGTSRPLSAGSAPRDGRQRPGVLSAVRPGTRGSLDSSRDSNVEGCGSRIFVKLHCQARRTGIRGNACWAAILTGCFRILRPGTMTGRATGALFHGARDVQCDPGDRAGPAVSVEAARDYLLKATREAGRPGSRSFRAASC